MNPSIPICMPSMRWDLFEALCSLCSLLSLSKSLHTSRVDLFLEWVHSSLSLSLSLSLSFEQQKGLHSSSSEGCCEGWIQGGPLGRCAQGDRLWDLQLRGLHTRLLQVKKWNKKEKNEEREKERKRERERKKRKVLHIKKDRERETEKLSIVCVWKGQERERESRAHIDYTNKKDFK